MGSAAFPTVDLADHGCERRSRPPELNEADFCEKVLRLAPGHSAAEVDSDLVARAARLGIEVASESGLPTPPPDASAGPAHIARTGRHNPAFLTDTEAAETPLTRFSTASHESTNTLLSLDMAIPATLTEALSGVGHAIMGSHGRVNLGESARARCSTLLSFSSYDKYLSELEANLTQPRFTTAAVTPVSKPERAGSIFSVGSRRRVRELKQSLSARLGRRRRADMGRAARTSCICCREEFSKDGNTLQTLPCGHTYCQNCLAVMLDQSIVDESKMPPRCCTQPIPAETIEAVLTRDQQQVFLKAVRQYSTPWETRVFCPNVDCGEFIDRPDHVDVRHPAVVTCESCRSRVCVMCKRGAHTRSQDCPDDRELEAVLEMGEKSGWRRCYNCRSLVELTQGCSHMTCRCKAQFCYICGAVWDPVVGCPNFCSGEEELERRRVAELAREAQLEQEKTDREAVATREADERRAAEKRTRESAAFQALAVCQGGELSRFLTFELKTKWIMWTRHAQTKLRMAERHQDQTDQMCERHARTLQHLEDRQIEAEIDLRATLDAQEKSIRIQLRHMEAYCNALGRSTVKDLPSREVTQKHLEQLGRQYHLRDSIARRHQAQINVMREQQAKRMEELVERQAGEMAGLVERRARELEHLMSEFAAEDEVLVRTFEKWREGVRRRWALQGEILRRESEELQPGLRYGPMELPVWPDDAERGNELAAVEEEGT